MKNLIYIILKILSKILSKRYSKKTNKFKILSQKEGIEYLIKERKALIRWGDGETTIFAGGSINFQKNYYSLMFSFWDIVKNYSHNSLYILAIPKNIIESDNKEIEKKDLWLLTKLIINSFFNANGLYLDSMMFREDSSLENKDIEKLWIDYKNIIFLHNNYKYYNDFKNKYHDKKIDFISVPSANSFEQNKKIINSINYIVHENNGTTCILLSSGPSSKYIIKRIMNNSSIFCLDMGHYFDYKFYNIKRSKKSH